jgi:hypothetical protein
MKMEIFLQKRLDSGSKSLAGAHDAKRPQRGCRACPMSESAKNGTLPGFVAEAEIFVIANIAPSAAVDTTCRKVFSCGTGKAISPRGDMPKNRVLIIMINKGAACHHIPRFPLTNFLV